MPVPLAPMQSPMQGINQGLRTGLLLANQARQSRQADALMDYRREQLELDRKEYDLKVKQGVISKAMDFGTDLISQGMGIKDPRLRSKWFRNQAAVAAADPKFSFLTPYLAGMAQADEDRQKDIMKEIKGLQGDLQKIMEGKDSFGSASAIISAQARIADAVSGGILPKELGKQLSQQLAPFFNYQTAEGQDIAAAARTRGLPPQAAAGGLLASMGLTQTPQGQIQQQPEYYGATQVGDQMVQPQKSGGDPRVLGPAGKKPSDYASVTIIHPATKDTRILQYRKGEEPQIPRGWVTESVYRDQQPSKMSEAQERDFVEQMFYDEMGAGDLSGEADYQPSAMMARYKELRDSQGYGTYRAAQQVIREFKGAAPTPAPGGDEQKYRPGQKHDFSSLWGAKQ